MKNDQNAFPIDHETKNDGMTLRDYFAAKAMQGLLRDSNANDGLWHFEATAAYEIADSMMEARKK